MNPDCLAIRQLCIELANQFQYCLALSWYISVRNRQTHEPRAPENAKRWLERVWDAVDSLEKLPRRAAKAQENDYVAYEVRQLVVDSHLLLFTVDDDKRTVWIVGLRHGHRRPRPHDLSPDLDALRGSDESES